MSTLETIINPKQRKVKKGTKSAQVDAIYQALDSMEAHVLPLSVLMQSELNVRKRPMAVGTREALLSDKKVRELPISHKKLKRSLAAISHSVKYRTTIMPGAVRYDKDGQPNGTVTELDVADTLKRIQKLAKQQSRIV